LRKIHKVLSILSSSYQSGKDEMVGVEVGEGIEACITCTDGLQFYDFLHGVENQLKYEASDEEIELALKKLSELLLPYMKKLISKATNLTTCGGRNEK
jgi:hypothetical protein